MDAGFEVQTVAQLGPLLGSLHGHLALNHAVLLSLSVFVLVVDVGDLLGQLPDVAMVKAKLCSSSSRADRSPAI